MSGVRVAIVTGGAGGLGSAIVRRLLDDGLRVAVADLSPDEPDSDAAMAVAVDVADPASVEGMVAAVHERFGNVDVLVNNAGIAGPSAPVHKYPVEDWRRVLEINLSGAFHTTRACLPDMIASGWGRIVNIASIAGKDGNPDMAAYSASKAGADRAHQIGRQGERAYRRADQLRGAGCDRGGAHRQDD